MRCRFATIQCEIPPYEYLQRHYEEGIARRGNPHPLAMDASQAVVKRERIATGMNALAMTWKNCRRANANQYHYRGDGFDEGKPRICV